HTHTHTQITTMKKLLVISFLALTSSLVYAGSSCGDKCDKDGKGDKAEAIESSVIVAGKDCGKKCGKKKDAEEAENTAVDTQFAGKDCGKKCDKKKDTEEANSSGFAASDYAVA
ncbi:MAG: hypothetical protein ABF324_00180, partial [Lentimonas sp.]